MGNNNWSSSNWTGYSKSNSIKSLGQIYTSSKINSYLVDGETHLNVRKI